LAEVLITQRLLVTLSQLVMRCFCCYRASCNN